VSPKEKKFAFPIGAEIPLSEMRRRKMSGLVIGTSEDRRQVSLCRLVEGEVAWREDYDPAEADMIADEMKRIAGNLPT
jgi:hypothetical protein